jgi:ribonuclease PH
LSGARRRDQLRPLKIHRGYTKSSPGSVLIEMGRTRVICTASVVGTVPPFLRGSGMGWVTAEYGMLPGSTKDRKSRGVDGRATEIQRIIGRSLRAVVDRAALGECSVFVDCDVIEADGGTRTASITGACVALADAFRWMQKEGKIERSPLREMVAAISVGVVGGKMFLDLDYALDSAAEVDMNIVMTESGKLVEVQGTAESKPFDIRTMDKMVSLAGKGIRKLIAIQKKELARS